MCCLCFICHQSNGQRVYELEQQCALRFSGRLLQLCCIAARASSITLALFLFRQVLWLQMSVRGRAKGHWWLIFWALADCVSNGALIVFGPPSPQTRPQKNPYKFPHAGQERRRSLPFRRSEQCGTALMCNLKSISLKRKWCVLSYLWWLHLNINRCFSSGEKAQIRGALTKDFPPDIQRNRVFATSLSIFIWCRMLRLRFIKVAQSVSSLVSLQSFHIVSKS